MAEQTQQAASKKSNFIIYFDGNWLLSPVEYVMFTISDAKIVNNVLVVVTTNNLLLFTSDLRF